MRANYDAGMKTPKKQEDEPIAESLEEATKSNGPERQNEGRLSHTAA